MSATRYALKHKRDGSLIADVLHTRNGVEVLHVIDPTKAKTFEFMTEALTFLLTEELDPFTYEAKPISL